MNLKMLTLAVTLAVTGPVAHAAEVEWRLGSSVGPKDPTTNELQKLAERVAERSNGRFQIEVIPIETLGFKNVDSLRVLKQGVLEAMNIIPYYVTRDEPLMGVFVPHGMLVDPEENLKIVDAQYEIGKEILRANWGIVQVERGPFAALRDLVIMTTRPMNTLEELRGIKFRHFTKDGLQAFNSLGVSTQVVPSSELYLALKTGVVDGAVYGPTYAKSQSIYEVTCCFSFLGAFSMAYPFSIGVNETTWEALPDDLRTILAEESRKMWEDGVSRWKEGAAEKAAYEWLTTEGEMEMLEPMPIEDRKAIQAELIKIWRENCKALGDRAVGYCDRIEKSLNN